MNKNNTMNLKLNSEMKDTHKMEPNSLVTSGDDVREHLKPKNKKKNPNQ